MDIAIAIFAKNPDLSPVKTRLAADIGKEEAIRIYKQLLEITESAVKEFVEKAAHNIIPYWALAEQESCTLPEWQNFKTLWTGEGELGERLHHIYSKLINNHDAVIMIGSDCPEIDVSTLNEASQILIESDNVVIGPSEDGGFYLFAFTHEIDKSIWLETPYSCSSTLEHLLAHLNNKSLKVLLLDPKRDLDNKKDLDEFPFLN